MIETLAMQFTLHDFAAAVRKLQALARFPDILSGILVTGAEENLENDARRWLTIIGSMTPDERDYPEQIHPHRTRRIARGSGTKPSDVDELIRQFLELRPMFDRLSPENDSSIRFQRRIWPRPLS